MKQKHAGDVPIKKKADMYAQQKQLQSNISMEVKVLNTTAIIVMRHSYESKLNYNEVKIKSKHVLKINYFRQAVKSVTLQHFRNKKFNTSFMFSVVQTIFHITISFNLKFEQFFEQNQDIKRFDS